MVDVIKVPPTRHSDFGASSAARWMTCAGSWILAKDSPRERDSSKYAAEGTTGHYIASLCIALGQEAADHIGLCYECDGFTFTVDADLAESIQVYLDSLAEYKGGDTLLAEVEVNYSRYLGLKKHEAWGTSDAVILHPAEFSVHDLKLGRGEVVSPIENEQMMTYALGVLDAYQELMDYGDDTKVTMVIHQPRVKRAPSEWSCTVADLLAFGAKGKLAVHKVKAAIWGYAAWKNEGRQAVEFNEWLDKYTVAGASQCRWCNAKATCPTMRNAAMLTAARAEPATLDEFKEVVVMDKAAIKASDNEWLAAAMEKAELVELWLKATRAEVESRMLAGHTIAGFKVVQGKKGDRAWGDAADAEAKLKAMRLKVEQMYNLKLISPTDAEKLSKGKAPVIGPRQWKSLQDLITRAEGKLHVAPVSDDRPAVQVKPVAEEFEDLGDTSIADDIG